MENNLLRIGQEAITNSLKYARAGRIRIGVDYQPRSIVLRIHDDGQGFDPRRLPLAEGAHFGLLGMRERAKQMGAKRVVAGSLVVWIGIVLVAYTLQAGQPLQFVGVNRRKVDGVAHHAVAEKIANGCRRFDADQFLCLFGGRRDVWRRDVREAAERGDRRARLTHAERLEDAVAHEVVPRRAGDFRNRLAGGEPPGLCRRTRV